MSKTEITTDRAWIESGVVRWYDQLARRIEEARADEETGEAPFCEVVPLERLNAFRFSVAGLAGVIVTVAIANGCAFASFQPEIPIEATQVKANADGLSVKYTGKPSNYFEVLRSLFVRRDPS